MSKKIDLTNLKFGKWTVLQESDKRDAAGGIMWTCQCDCGTIRDISGSSLRKGKSTCCGCEKQNQSNELIGQKFGKLTVLEKLQERSKNGSILWKCLCDCGNECIRSTVELHKKDRVQNCGCYNKTVQLDLSIIGKKYGKLTVLEYDNKTCKWKCQCDCGNITYVRKDSLLSGNTSSCGCINYSIGEKHIQEILIANSILYKPQYTNKELKLKKFDFAILNNKEEIIRLIEFDGEQHYNDISGIWNVSETLEKIQQRDQEKNEWAKKHNIPLVRIPYWERDNITLDIIMGDKYLIC